MPTGFPLAWPQGWRRTDPSDRRYLPGKGRVSFSDSRSRLLHELELLGVDQLSIVLSTNMPLRADGLPMAGRSELVPDPGVAVYFKLDDRPLSFACDAYAYVRDNMRAIALTIEALRGLQRWGASDMMDRAFRGFLALPQTATRPWREVLGFKSNEAITLAAAEKKFRDLSHKLHPDVNPDLKDADELFRQLTEARAIARKELSS